MHEQRLQEVDWERMCIDLFTLLDAIEDARYDVERLDALIYGRFDIAESYGLQMRITGIQGGGNMQ